MRALPAGPALQSTVPRELPRPRGGAGPACLSRQCHPAGQLHQEHVRGEPRERRSGREEQWAPIWDVARVLLSRMGFCFSPVHTFFKKTRNPGVVKRPRTPAPRCAGLPGPRSHSSAARAGCVATNHGARRCAPPAAATVVPSAMSISDRCVGRSAAPTRCSEFVSKRAPI